LHQEPQHPLELARDHLDDAVPLLTPGNPLTTAESLVEGGATVRRSHNYRTMGFSAEPLVRS
jgi:hypothetical protein